MSIPKEEADKLAPITWKHTEDAEGHRLDLHHFGTAFYQIGPDGEAQHIPLRKIYVKDDPYPPPGISEPQLALAKRMEEAIRPKPMAELVMTSQSWVHVGGDHDSAIVVVRNGHVIGWLSAFELAQVMDGLKNACRWSDGVPLKFL